MNDKLQTLYLSLLQFVTIFEEKARYQVQKLEDIRYEKMKSI